MSRCVTPYFASARGIYGAGGTSSKQVKRCKPTCRTHRRHLRPARERCQMDAEKIKLQWGVRIPLRDGVTLGATLYTPRNQSDPLPCVFMPTPYIADTHHGR